MPFPCLCLAHSLWTHRIDIPIAWAISALVRFPFLLTHYLPHLFLVSFMPFGSTRSTCLPNRLRQTHTPLFPVTESETALFFTDFTYSERR